MTPLAWAVVRFSLDDWKFVPADETVSNTAGVPAVVGCGNATQRLRGGDRVRVDGAKGSVEVLA